jgi:hypothetical protein
MIYNGYVVMQRKKYIYIHSVLCIYTYKVAIKLSYDEIIILSNGYVNNRSEILFVTVGHPATRLNTNSSDTRARHE